MMNISMSDDTLNMKLFHEKQFLSGVCVADALLGNKFDNCKFDGTIAEMRNSTAELRYVLWSLFMNEVGISYAKTRVWANIRQILQIKQSGEDDVYR